MRTDQQVDPSSSYVIITSFNPDDLAKKVSELMVDGFQPLGGPFVIGQSINQAVYKPAAVKL